MKELAFLKITISIVLVVGPFGVGLYFKLSGKMKVVATASAGPVTKGYATCPNCDPKANNGITGEFTAFNPLAGSPFILNYAKDSQGHVETTAGVGTTITDPTGTIGVRAAVTQQIYSYSPSKGIPFTNKNGFENFGKFREIKLNRKTYRYQLGSAQATKFIASE